MIELKGVCTDISRDVSDSALQSYDLYFTASACAPTECGQYLNALYDVRAHHHGLGHLVGISLEMISVTEF